MPDIRAEIKIAGVPRGLLCIHPRIPYSSRQPGQTVMSPRSSVEKEAAVNVPDSGDESTTMSLGAPGAGAGSGSRIDVVPDQTGGLRNRFESQSHLDVEQDPLALERINTYRLQQQETVGSGITHRTRTPREHWLPLGAGKPFPPSPPDPEEYVVEFNGSDDPMHPQNWPLKQR